MSPRITVIIPTLNEGKTIAKVVSDFRRELPEAAIIVYDNNSDDATQQEAKKSGAKVVIQPARGKGNSVRKSFEEIESDIYIMVDGDDTYPATDVKKLLKPVLEGKVDMVVGSRLKIRAKGALNFFHIIGNTIITGLVNLCFNMKLSDMLSGYRVMTRKLVKDVILTASGFEIETELTIKTLSQGYTIKEIPVEYRSRPQESKSKLNTFTDGYLIMYTIFMLLRDYRPIFFFSTIALIFLLAGVVLGLYVTVEWLTTGFIRHFPTAILSSLLIMISFQLFMVGLFSDLINKKFEQIMYVLRKRENG